MRTYSRTHYLLFELSHTIQVQLKSIKPRPDKIEVCTVSKQLNSMASKILNKITSKIE